MKWRSWLVIAISGVIIWWALLVFAAHLLNFVVSWETLIGGIVAICGMSLAIPLIQKSRNRH